MSTTSSKNPLIRSNRTYDLLKYFAQIVLPALGALYFGLSEIWGFPYGVEVVGTITVIDVFLGALLGLSAQAYRNSDVRFDGAFVVDEEEGGKLVTLEYENDPYLLDEKDEVLFKVKHRQSA